MKKTLLMLIILVSCNKKSNTNQVTTTTIVYEQIKESNTRNTTDSIKKSFLDTLNIKQSPVKIISAKLFTSQYSDHKDIGLVYKNASKKNIKAIRFEWYCENAFDKPASGKNFFVKGKSDGYISTLLKPKEKKSHVWEDFSTDANTIISVRAYHVVFTDGTKWDLKK